MIRRGDKLICPSCKGCELALLNGRLIHVVLGRQLWWWDGTPRHAHGNRVIHCRLCGWRTTAARAREQL